MNQNVNLAEPMGATAIRRAAEGLLAHSAALTGPADAIAAYGASTGLCVGVVEMPNYEKSHSEVRHDEAPIHSEAQVETAAPPPMCAADAASETPTSGTIDEALEAGARAVALIRAEVNVPPKAKAKKPAEDDVGEEIAPAVILAIRHIRTLKPQPKWGHDSDLELVERAIGGETEKAIGDVMEFSPSFIRQRFNNLIGRKASAPPDHNRKDVLEALKIICAVR